MPDRNNGPNTERTSAGRFARGNAGRPRGARHKTTLAVEALLEGEAEGLTRKAVEMAMAGDTTALRLCMERICPPRKDAPVQGAKFIYIGGRMARLYKGEPPVYMADYEQNYVSNYYAKPDNQIITIKHKMGGYDDNWFPNEHLVPMSGTPVEFGFSTKEIVKRLPTKVCFPDAGKNLEPVEESGKESGKKEAGKKDGEKSGEKKQAGDDQGKKGDR